MSPTKEKQIIRAAMITMCLLVSCTGMKNVRLSSSIGKNSCDRQTNVLYAKEDLPKPLHPSEIDPALADKFSFRALNAANAVGMLGLLSELAAQKESLRLQTSAENRIRFVELTQRIYQKIHISSLEISATASEMDCEEERADQVASYLKRREDETETKLTAGAIVIGAPEDAITGIFLPTIIREKFPNRSE